LAQTASDPLTGVTHDATLTFVQRNGTCVRGTILKFDTASVTVVPFKQPPVTLARNSLLQVNQGNALLFSGRSSWSDVEHTHLYPREALVLTMKSGERIKGNPMKVASDSITLKHRFSTTTFLKSDVSSVDYLRSKPATDGFNLALEEAPWALIFYPEFYYRAGGLEGRIPVRLYDVSQPQDETVSGIKQCF
jgi:hypothetical protein